MSGAGKWGGGFPKVMHFVDLENLYAKPWGLLQARPDYDAAKNREDRGAALRLVMGFLETGENRKQLRLLREKYPGAIIVPVRAIEAHGKNKIPIMLAEYIAKRTGLEIDTNIVQTNTVHRTGSGEFHRFAFRPEFGGDVREGGRYIPVDDVFAQGGSFSELKRFIEKNGGEVVQTAALSLGGHGDDLAMLPGTRKRLLDRFGEEKLNLFLKEINLYEGNCEYLTEPEAFALGRAPSLDEARDRILAARRQGNARVGGEETRGREAPQMTRPKTRRR